MKTDPYIEHMTSVIADLKKQTSEAESALNSYVKFHGKSSPAARTITSTQAIYEKALSMLGDDGKSDDAVDRKGLRSKGKARDIFEFLNRNEQSFSIEYVSKITGYDTYQVTQFYHRYSPTYIQKSDSEKIYLTKAGKDLVNKSQPYAGDNKAVLLPPNGRLALA